MSVVRRSRQEWTPYTYAIAAMKLINDLQLNLFLEGTTDLILEVQS